MASDTQFREIEYKYLVDESFDLGDFDAKVLALKPERKFSVLVADTYFVFPHLSNLVYRHRYDGTLQDLAIKSLEQDPTNRLEVNLKLTLDHGNQIALVRKFLSAQGEYWSGEVRKAVDVYLFPDVEIVYYTATSAGRSISCVEVEAKAASTVESALQTLEIYAKNLDLHQRPRASLSLFEMLLLPQMQQQLVKGTRQI